MTERKFTPPTEFPAEYVNGYGDKAVVLGRRPNCSHPFIGYDCEGEVCTWTMEGANDELVSSRSDLHDTPKRITTWHNVYSCSIRGQYASRRQADAFSTAHQNRLCLYRIERDEDGGNPEIFVEEV